MKYGAFKYGSGAKYGKTIDLNETVTTASTLAKMGIPSVFLESITLNEIFTSSLTYVQNLLETITTVDRAVRFSVGKLLKDTATIVGDFQFQITIAVLLQEAVRVVDTLVRGFYITLIERLKIKQFFRLIFGGLVDGLWKRTDKDNGVWTKKEREL